MAPIELLPGVALATSLARDGTSLEVDLLLGGHVAWSTRLAHGQLTDRWSANQGLFREELEIRANLERGELEISGELCARVGAGHTARFDRVFRWAPALGLVGRDSTAHAPAVVDPGLGRSSSIVPTITRIFVDDTLREGTEVGGLAKAAYFRDHPDFVFNVAFAVGAFEAGGPGPYTDPRSPWFNVFSGYYQIDCPKPAWSRPFGYEGGAVRFDDMLRLGKADWNYFSNWMYGVPLAAITPFAPLDDGVLCELLGRRDAGAGAWDVVDIDGFSVVTAYAKEGANALEENTPITKLWRLTYGEPTEVPDDDRVFPGASMHARFLVCFAETEEAFHTWFFGGTVNKTFDGPDNERLLAAQIDAAAKVIDEHYPSLGFAHAR